MKMLMNGLRPKHYVHTYVVLNAYRILWFPQLLKEQD